MKRIVLSLLLVLPALAAAGQQTVQSDEVLNFHALSFSGNLVVELVPSGQNSIDVTLHGADASRLRWGVNNGVLSVSLRPTPGVDASATVRIGYSEAPGSLAIDEGRIDMQDTIRTHMMRVTVSGGAIVSAAIEAADVEVEVTGNSVARLAGSAKYLTLRATERSRVDTRPLEAASVDVDAATGAEVYVHALERLVANARTAATIFYKGQPGIVKDRSSKVSVGIGSAVLSIGD